MKVVTSVVNNPKFIEIQYHTLKKNMKCDYEFIVFNDAKDFPDFTNYNTHDMRTKIDQTCKSLGIRCIPIPNDHHRTLQCAAVRCANACNFMLKYQLENPDKYMQIDSDMFLVSSFDYSDYDAAVVLQSRPPNINYIWNGLVYFDTTRISNKELLNWDVSPGCDVGGKMQQWLSRQSTTLPDINVLRHPPSPDQVFVYGNVYFIKHLWSCSWDITELPKGLEYLTHFLMTDPRNVNGKFFCEVYDKRFLHYRAGGNWQKEGAHLHGFLTDNLYNVLCAKV
jgi:hypothetical protein